MNRRTLLPALVLLPLVGCAPARLPVPGGVDQADVDRVQARLDSVQTLSARFVQERRGIQSTGTAFLERPGRLCLQYDPPSGERVVANRGRLIVADTSTGASSSIALDHTPLSILLARHVSLGGPVTVTELRRMPGLLVLSARSTAHPGQGGLTLTLSEPELLLQAVRLTGPHGEAIDLRLSDVQVNKPLDQAVFELPVTG